MVTHIPPGHTKVRILKASMYAFEELPVGMVAVLDAATATRLIKEKRAEPVKPDPPREITRTTCPRCGCAMEYATEFEPTDRWVECGNPRCRFGWLR